jgi:hypothetical protein
MLVGAKINVVLFLWLRFEKIGLGDVQFVERAKQVLFKKNNIWTRT